MKALQNKSPETPVVLSKARILLTVDSRLQTISQNWKKDLRCLRSS